MYGFKVATLLQIDISCHCPGWNAVAKMENKIPNGFLPEQRTWGLESPILLLMSWKWPKSVLCFLAHHMLISESWIFLHKQTGSPPPFPILHFRIFFLHNLILRPYIFPHQILSFRFLWPACQLLKYFRALILSSFGSTADLIHMPSPCMGWQGVLRKKRKMNLEPWIVDPYLHWLGVTCTGPVTLFWISISPPVKQKSQPLANLSGYYNKVCITNMLSILNPMRTIKHCQ